MSNPKLNPEYGEEVKKRFERILRECNFLIEHSKEVMFEDFIKSPLLIRAFTKCLELIGEEVKKIPKDIKNEYTNIPWKDIAGMRDLLVHNFYNVKFEIVWNTIKNDVPELKKQIEEIMKRVAEMEEELNRREFEL